MPTPDPLLAWLGVVGGALGIVTAAVNLFIIWRNRGRIDFRVLSVACYYQNWQEYDRRPDIPLSSFAVKVGDCCQTFSVIEFAITNGYPTEAVVGRMMIDGWMFEGRYRQGMYDWRRDYRVFELSTRAPTALDSFRTVPANGSVSLRVEAIVNANGPAIESHARAYALDPYLGHTISFFVGPRRIVRRIRMPRESCQFGDPRLVHHWSDLAPVAESNTGAPLPQGLPEDDAPYPPMRLSRMSWTMRVNRFIYGRSWHYPEDLSRWRILASLQKRTRSRRKRGP